MLEKEMSEKPRKEKIRDELNKMKRLSWKEKIVYFWDYYKIVLVILVIILVAIRTGITIVHNLNTEELFNAIFFNCYAMPDDTEAFEQAFAEYLGGLEKDQKLTMDFSVSISSEDWDTSRMVAETKVMAYSADHSLDCMVMPEAVYDNYLAQEVYMNLDEVLTLEEQQSWKDDLKRDIQGEDAQEHIYGVRIDRSDKIQEFGLYTGNEEDAVYLAVPVSSERAEMVVRFLHFLLDKGK